MKTTRIRICGECRSTRLVKTNIGDYECTACGTVQFPSDTRFMRAAAFERPSDTA